MRKAPDNRLRWDAPDLPCIRAYRMASGELRTEIDPEYERRYREHMLQNADQPDWRKDPTYNLRRKK